MENLPENSRGDEGRQSDTKVSPSRVSLSEYKVLIHRDDVMEVERLLETLVEVAGLSEAAAAVVAMETNNEGCGTVFTTHRERAELYIELFAERGLIATLAPAA